MRGKNAGFKGVKVKCGNAAVWEIQRRCECEKDLQDVMLINVCAFPFFLFFFNYILFLLLLCCCCCYIFEITTTNGADWFVNLTQWINPWICIYIYIHKCVSVCVYMYYNFSFFQRKQNFVLQRVYCWLLQVVRRMSAKSSKKQGVKETAPSLLYALAASVYQLDLCTCVRN